VADAALAASVVTVAVATTVAATIPANG